VPVAPAPPPPVDPPVPGLHASENKPTAITSASAAEYSFMKGRLASSG
jgi:hypothetical protein